MLALGDMTRTDADKPWREVVASRDRNLLGAHAFHPAWGVLIAELGGAHLLLIALVP
jgi:hypothetical protein